MTDIFMEELDEIKQKLARIDMVAVPIEPTDLMKSAGKACLKEKDVRAEDIYQSMLLAGEDDLSNENL